MTDPADIALKLAAENMVWANTPLFLLRKLREDPAVRDIKDKCSPSAVYRALRSIAKTKPATFEDKVRPYAYLVALSQMAEPAFFNKAARVRVVHAPWFRYIADYVQETTRPTLSVEIRASPLKPGFATTTGSSKNAFIGTVSPRSAAQGIGSTASANSRKIRGA